MSTRTHEHHRRHERPERDGQATLSLKDLVIAALSATAAALIVSQFWRNGTLIATAMTPVIVSIARELLARPKATVSQVGRKISAVAPAPAPASRRGPLDDPDPVLPPEPRREPTD